MSSSREPASSTPPDRTPSAAPTPAQDVPPIRMQHAASASKRLEMRYHLLILAVSVGVLILSFSLSVEGNLQVVLPVLGQALPSTCAFRNLIGLDCPGCGLTRSFISLAHGRWTESFNFHPIGWLMFGLVAVQVPFRLIQVFRLGRNQPVIYWPSTVWLGWAVMILLICQWVVRGVGGRW